MPGEVNLDHRTKLARDRRVGKLTPTGVTTLGVPRRRGAWSISVPQAGRAGRRPIALLLEVAIAVARDDTRADEGPLKKLAERVPAKRA